MTEHAIQRECRSWPADQAARWCAAFDPLTPSGWQPRTRRGRAYAWNLYLRHCREHGLPLCLTEAGVASFARACHARGVTGRSFHAYATALADVARIVDPKSPFLEPLEQRNRLGQAPARREPRRKTAHLARAPKADVLFDLLCTELARLAEELDCLGVERLRADAARPSRARSGLVRYRGALITALLLACPERRGAATELLCSDLAPDLTDLTYRAATTKPDLDNPQPVPVELRPHLRRWLALRAAFAPRHDRLWIRLQEGIGAPAGSDTIYRDIKATLQRVAGIELWPNLLRDLGSTFAREELHHVPHLASSVLNHQDPRTTRIYTEQAKDTAALKATQGAMARAVEAAGRRARRQHRGPARTVLAGRYRPRRNAAG